MIVFKLTLDISDISFGGFLGVFLIFTIIYLRGIIAFRKNAKTTVAVFLTREYVYSVFDETLKIEVFDQGNKINEEHRKYTDIQAVNDIGTYILLNISGRIFIIRKADLSANSLLLTVFDEPIKNAKKRRKTALIILFVCIAAGIVMGTLGEFSEKFTKDQAMENMKAAIEKTYDEYELLTWFNIHKDGRFTDALILVESDGKIDVLGYASQNGEYITVEKCIGMTPESDNVIGYLADGSAVAMRIYPNETDIPDNVDIKAEFQYRNRTMYFCVTFVENPSDLSPIHFKGLNDTSTRKDVEALYGIASETKEAIYPEEYYYDIYYVSFLDISGEMDFFYYEDSPNDLFRVTFTIDSRDFSSYEEYSKAVEKTYRYFVESLIEYQLLDKSTEDKVSIQWIKENLNYAYSIYSSQMHDGNFDNIRDCTVFQFNEYPQS